MQLVEKHSIKKSHKFFNELDQVCFQSKNIYNTCLFHWKNHLKVEDKFLSSKELYPIIKEQECYKSIPQNVAVQTFLLFFKNVKSYFESLKDYKKHPEKYNSKPKIPRYKDSLKGRFMSTYTNRVIPKTKFLKDGKLRLTGLNLSLKTQIKDFGSINQVRIIPRNSFYVVEVVYTVKPKKYKRTKNIASIDLGVNNLATIGFNDFKTPLIVNGRPIKSINQFYNKTKSKYESKLKNIKTSKRTIRITNKRNNKINDYLHKASKSIMNQLVSRDVSKLIIGYNQNWKQDINIGKRNNQNFVGIPFYKFINMLEYKCELNGIKVVKTEESYTSKCSFLDNEKVKKHETYKGRRIKRGLFKSKTGRIINADLNGSYNIMKKVVPNIKPNGIADVVVHPKVLDFKN